MKILFLVFAFIALFAFFMYDRANTQYIRQLKRTIQEQNKVIKEQQELIKSTNQE